MSELKWIKLDTDIFEDEKVLLIEARSDADSVLVIWIKMLTLAGKTNNSGVFVFAKDIPYTAEMLATIFRRPLETVQNALECFEQFGMIEIIDGVITIPNWEKHQSIDELDRIREQTRLRVQRHRDKQKQIANGNATCNATVTLCNATEENRKEQNNYIVEIVAHLNERCGTSYRDSSRKTQQLIRARLSEGFTQDDFIKVIDTKASEWCGTEYEKYLRPQTLFGTKFESYLNQTAIVSDKPQRKVTTHEEIEAMKKAEGVLHG